ncbi:MAG TPA: hypothetical protein VKU85_00905, partial [bacterium]|nr:hypothetical protein [bacterium]
MLPVRPQPLIPVVVVLGLLSLSSAPAPESAPPFGMTDKEYAVVRAKGPGHPRPDQPDEFHRIHAEMRTRPDRAEPDYPLGYRMRELERARERLGATDRRAGGLPWVERGPGNVAGRARGLVVDPDDPAANTWFVGSVGGGVWRTSDAGGSWTLLTPDFPTLAVSTIAMADSDHDVLYAGTGESFYNIDTIHGDGIFKSTDRGLTWVALAGTVGSDDFHNVARIVVDPADEDVVVAATTTGRYRESIAPESQIMKSTDGGTTWTEAFVETETGMFGPVKKVQQIVADPTDFSNLYAAVDEEGILVSTDAGDSWAYSNSGITDFRGRFELAISPLNSSLIFASAEGNSHSELWVSEDAGATWNETVEGGGEPNWLGSQGWYDNTILCDPTDSTVVYLGGIWLWQAQVNLDTYSRTTSFLSNAVHADQHNLRILDDGGSWRILNANDGGVAVSTSMASGFTRPINGMNTSQFYGVDKRPGGSAYIGGMQDNGTWRSPLDSAAPDLWTFQIGGDGYETSWHFNDPQLIIGGSQFNGIRRSTDGGVTWNNATSGGLGSDGGPFITKIAKSNDAPDLLFAVGSSGVWRSTDFGADWSLTPISAPDWLLNSFCDVKISRANPDVVWAGAYISGSGRINLSTDGGLTFSPASSATPVPMGLISGMSTHPVDDQIAYVLFSYAQAPKILRTTDQGASWHDISGFGVGNTSTNGFPDVAVYDLLVRPDDPGILWAGTEIGLVESTDNGASWALAANGPPAAAIWAMTHVEDEVVAATHGRGIWCVSIQAMGAGQTFTLLLENLAQVPIGMMRIDAYL